MYMLSKKETFKDYSAEIQELINKAEEKDPHMQFELGVRFANGHGVEKDEKKAVEWYQKAAVSQHLEALLCLIDCFEKGRGVDKNLDKAKELYNNFFYLMWINRN